MLVFINGCFDILHLGHIKLLEFANSYGDVFVGLNSDKSIKKLKGKKRPIYCEDDRKLMLLSIKYVYDVIIYDELTPINIIAKLNPDIIIVGYDHSISNKCYKDSIEVGRIIIKAPKFHTYSTSQTIKKIYGKHISAR
jgi:D-beta-D-heptose 7-phosphate kinase/D-beta-D-heptose 1-phosphate adenosyltransferase